MTNLKNKRNRQRGFTLIEAMISILILSFGILSLAVVYAQGIQYANATQAEFIAQKKAEEAVETIFTARDTQVLAWSQIANVTGVSGASGGVFLDGPTGIYAAGVDGLLGTADDDTSQPDSVVVGPGPDNILGTTDDLKVNLNPWMTRTIAITPVNNEANLRQITITMNYTIAGRQKVYTLISYISRYS